MELIKEFIQVVAEEDEADLKYFADRMRHLVCIPYSVENLHRMAEELGIKRHWFHSNTKHKHYDIPKRMVKQILSDPRVTVISPRDILKIIAGETNERIFRA